MTRGKQHEAVSMVMKKFHYHCQEWKSEWLICRQLSERLDPHDLGETAGASNIEMAEVIFV